MTQQIAKSCERILPSNLIFCFWQIEALGKHCWKSVLAANGGADAAIVKYTFGRTHQCWQDDAGGRIDLSPSTSDCQGVRWGDAHCLSVFGLNFTLDHPIVLTDPPDAIKASLRAANVERGSGAGNIGTPSWGTLPTTINLVHELLP
jgi:hypothetical protein